MLTEQTAYDIEGEAPIELFIIVPVMRQVCIMAHLAS